MIVKSLIVGTGAALVAVVTAAGCSSDPKGTADGGDAMVEVGPDVKEAKAPMETSMDAGLMCPDPKTDFTTFMPPMSVIPPRPSTDSCTPMQITSYWTACRDAMSTNMTCSAWRTANMACGQCLESNDTDQAWGPLVRGSGLYVTNGTIRANSEGCLIKLGYQACADATFRQGLCTKYACEEQCPVSDTPSFTEYTKCVTKATTGGCKTYADKATMECNSDAAPNFQACRGTNFQDYFNKIAPIFCSAGG